MLKDFIDKFYLDREKEKEEKERVKFYISEVGKCPRSIFFRFKQAPKREIEAERLRVFEFGNHIQQIILKPLFSFGLVRATEIPIPPQELISGRADIIISIDGEPYVIDVKSISGKMNFAKMDKPMPEHLWQVQLYLHYFKIKKGGLLYVNKDTQELKEFFLEYDKELCEQLLDWFKKLKEKIENNLIPARLVDYPNNWQCEKCEYRDLCKLAEKEIKWEDLKKKIEAQNKGGEK
jgi:CRISPR/Cas system-associated exonuclease Cas4 (RecB family)